MRSNVLLISLLVLAGCSSKSVRPISRQLIESATYKPQESVTSDPVQLTNGNWDGPSDTGFSHPYVSMMPDFTVYGDIDGDGNNEAAVIVHESGGGSGVFRILGLFGRTDEEVRHLGSIALGDRTQVRSVQIQPGQLIAEYVRAAEGEPRCCPTEVARTHWSYSDGKFSVASDELLGKLSPSFLAGSVWELQPPNKSAITLTFADGHFSGEDGCTHYEAGVKEGEYGGAIVVDGVTTTPSNCDSNSTEPNRDFLKHVQNAKRMGFLPGNRLWLSYDLGGDKESGTLEFAPATR